MFSGHYFLSSTIHFMISSSESLVEFRNLTFGYGQRAVLNDITLTLLHSKGGAQDITKMDQATVNLAMESQYHFPKDSSLKILTSGLRGEQYLGVEAGADEKSLANDDRVSTTPSTMVLENLISQFLFSEAAQPPESSAASAPASPASK
jgi:hypothetical protein